jgi:hypothetical protein
MMGGSHGNLIYEICECLDTKGFPLIVLEAKSEDKNLELIARIETKIPATIAWVWGEEG